jgi:long-chain acyl-CoA synthetase
MPHRPWTDHYVQGTRPEIPPIPYKHLPDMFRYVASRFGPRIAFTQCMPNGMDASLTFAETARLSDAFAAYLRETLP